MPMVLNITADNAEELVAEFRKLNELTASDNSSAYKALASMPLNEFLDLATAKLRSQGFKIVADEPSSPPEPVSEPLPEPADEPKVKKTKAKAPAEEASPPPSNNVEEFPQPRRAKPAPDEDPEGDRQHVLDTLAGILKNPARKAEVLAFTGAQAKLHGTEKISELPAAPFPAIRREMEKAFPDVRSA